MSKIDLGTFGDIVDEFLKENGIQMLLTVPEGSDDVDVQVEDNAGLGGVVQFYILLNAIKPITADMRIQMGIDDKPDEWKRVAGRLLSMIEKELLGDGAEVDAEPVRHGWWEYGSWEKGHWVKGNDRCRCSVCQRDFAVDNRNIWNGCPHCLAKMDLEDGGDG